MGDKTIDDVLSLVTEEETVVGGVEAFIASLKQQVLDAAKGTPAQVAAINSVFDKVSAQKQRLADAIVTGTPVDPNAPPAAR